MKKVTKLVLFILLAMIIIVIGDDETRQFLKRTTKRVRGSMPRKRTN